MILFNHDLVQNIILDSYLKTECHINSILKEHYLFISDDDKVDMPKIERYLIPNLEDYTYLVTNHDINNLFDFPQFNAKGFEIVKGEKSLFGDPFVIPGDKFWSRGNITILYFSTPKISNPLSVIEYIINKVVLSEEYNDVIVDYVLKSDKIIFYVIFKYSGHIISKMKEIIHVKESVIKKNDDTFEEIEFPEEQLLFQNELLSTYPKIETISNYLKFEGICTFSPFSKLQKIHGCHA